MDAITLVRPISMYADPEDCEITPVLMKIGRNESELLFPSRMSVGFFCGFTGDSSLGTGTTNSGFVETEKANRSRGPSLVVVICLFHF